MQTETSTNENFKFEVGEERAFIVPEYIEYNSTFEDVAFKMYGTRKWIYIKKFRLKLIPHQIVVLRQTDEPVPVDSDGEIEYIDGCYYWEIVE